MEIFGKIEDGVLVRVPNSGMIGNVMHSKLTEEEHYALGHKKVLESFPELGLGQEPVFDKYEEDERTITVVYRAETAPDNLKISKIKLRIALAQAGLWQHMERYLETMDLQVAPGVSINGMDVWNDALIIDFGDPQFEPFLVSIKTLFADVLTEQQINEILAQCKAD